MSNEYCTHGTVIEIWCSLCAVESLRAQVAALTEERDAANYAYHYSSAEVTRLRAALEAARDRAGRARRFGDDRETLALILADIYRATDTALAPEGKAKP